VSYSLEEFLAGGYLLTRPVNRNDAYMGSDLLPEHILSVGSCLADCGLEYWWSEDNVVEAADFGVPKRIWPGLIT
jgi:hypothetical protein